ncbi:MAG: threonine synthase [Methanobrevibacter sp.]|jgi:threonine synthase|nr:threonine synthase [Candidatus Methanovirga aequatorialis]
MIKCVSCEQTYDDDKIVYICEKCGSVLEVEVESNVLKDVFSGRKLGLWKYKEFIPVNYANVVSLGEGGTPFCRCDKIGKELGVELYAKVEGSNPTGSFKDRGMSVGVTKAVELGVDTVGCASTGNTSAALAAYAARGGLRSIVLLPAGKVALGKLAQAMFYGSEVLSINGNFDQALESATRLANEKYIYLLNSINPFRLEGQKSIGFEIIDELDWKSPDRIILPVGNAGNISAIWKGITEFYNAGYIDEKPIMTGIQAEKSAPIVEAFKNKAYNINPVENPETVATAIRIGNPVSYIKALRAIYDSNGYADSVTDEEILSAQKLLARLEGIGVEPASAASIAGLKKLIDEGVVDKGERVVAVVTGHVLKDPDVAIKASTEPIEVEPDFNQIKTILEKNKLDS